MELDPHFRSYFVLIRKSDLLQLLVGFPTVSIGLISRPITFEL